MTVLLERDADVTALRDAVARARSGRGSLVLVGGEAGIGKTSLVRAVRDEIGDRARFLIGACEPLSVPVPLLPIRELAAAARAAGLRELAGDDRLALASALLELLAQHPPTVAVVEDAHWADPATLDVVRLVARRVESAPVVALVTYRDDELAANPALGRLVGDLVTAPAVRRLTLQPLSAAAIRALAEPAGVDPSALLRTTGGNPLLVVESIASGGEVPGSVRDATLSRVGRLGPVARGAVDAAAVIGRRVPLSVLALVAPDSEDGIAEALDHGVLTDDGETLGFRHDLIRQAVESSIAAPRRTELHARVLNALASSDRSADHARLAHHAERAGLAAEAAEHARHAADTAERVGALAEASSQLERVLRFAPDAPTKERFDLLLRYSRTANFSGRVDEAIASAEAAVALARELGDRRALGRATGWLAATRWSLDLLPEARAAADEAIAVLNGTGDVAELARAHAARLRMEALAFDPGAAIAQGPRALALAAGCGSEELRVDVLVSLGVAHGHRGEEQARALLDEALAAGLAAGLHVQCIRACVSAGGAALDVRDHAWIEGLAAPASALVSDYQSQPARDALAIDMAWSLLDRGRYDEALAVADSARDSRLGFRPLRLALEGVVAARRGTPGGEALLAQADAALRDVAHGRRHLVVRTALAEAAWIRGDHAGVRAHASAGRAAPFADQFSRPAGDLALWAMRCGEPGALPTHVAEPVRRELAGDWRGAIRAWDALHAPYEAALAALAGDERAARKAVAALHALGASASARAFTRERARAGAPAPRGPRRSTLANSAGLTRREQEILERLARGATNATIAGALHLSERTVSHHVSAVLRKLDASTRTAAVDAARRRGLLSQDGTPDAPI